MQFADLTKLPTSVLCPELIADRLILEPLVQSHATMLFDYLQSAAIYHFIPDLPPENLSALTTRFDVLERRWSKDKGECWLNWAVRFKNGEQYVGTVQSTVKSDMSAAIAYIIFPSFWRCGYATEACACMIDYLHSAFGIDVFTASLDTRNANSARLLEKLKFNRTGYIPNADVIRGERSDEYEYTFTYV